MGSHLRGDLSPLPRALVSGDVDEVRRALDEDPERAKMPLMSFACDPPLCAAIRRGCGADVAKLLLDRGADVHAVDSHGRTPLLVACAQACGNFSSLDAVLDGNSSFWPEDLHKAADPLVEVLLDAGADITHVDASGLGALHLARNAGKEHLRRLLLECGAPDVGQDVDARLEPWGPGCTGGGTGSAWLVLENASISSFTVGF